MDEIAKEINDSIINSEVYKCYLTYKKKINKDSSLCELKNKMKEIKNKNCKDKNDKLVTEYYALEKEYKDNILVKEYESYKKEVYDLLSEVADILSFK